MRDFFVQAKDTIAENNRIKYSGGDNMVIRLRKSILAVTALSLIFCAVFAWYRQSAVSALSPVQTAAQKSVSLPVIMYHQLTVHDNVGRYILSVEQLESDLKYIIEKGYETVTVADLIKFVKGEGELPEKPIMLTFDDGYETGCTMLYPLLKKYNMCAVVSVIGSLTDMYTEIEDHNDFYSYLTWDEVKFLSSTKEIEIQNHSYDMHYSQSGKRKGIGKLKNESFDDYYDALYNDVGKMQLLLMKKASCKATAIAYPFGNYSKETTDICKRLGFECSFTCEEKVNTVVKYNRESLFNLGRYNRASGKTSKEFFEGIVGGT